MLWTRDELQKKLWTKSCEHKLWTISVNKGLEQKLWTRIVNKSYKQKLRIKDVFRLNTTVTTFLTIFYQQKIWNDFFFIRAFLLWDNGEQEIMWKECLKYWLLTWNSIWLSITILWTLIISFMKISAWMRAQKL